MKQNDRTAGETIGKVKAGYTPGPWKRENWASGWEVCAPDSHYTVCRLSGCNNADQNARLIAAAPELLEACKKALRAIRTLELWGGVPATVVDLRYGEKELQSVITEAEAAGAN